MTVLPLVSNEDDEPPMKRFDETEKTFRARFTLWRYMQRRTRYFHTTCIISTTASTVHLIEVVFAH